MAAWQELQNNHGYAPPTWAAETGSGGLHLWFTLPEGVRHGNSRGTLPPGLDVRAGGRGYVVVPPSLHPATAQSYRWKPGHAPLEIERAPIPDWLLRLTRKPRSATTASGLRATNGPSEAQRRGGATTPYGHAAIDGECVRLADAPRGTRNQALNRAAFSLGQLVAQGDVNEPEACAALLHAADACGLVAEDGTERVRRTLLSGLHAGMRSPRPASPRFDPPPPRGDQTRRQFKLTDTGNAERLIARSGKDIRYSSTLGWLVWDGRRWQRDSGCHRTYQFAKDAIRALYLEARATEDPYRRVAIGKHATKSESRRARDAVVALAKHEAGIAVEVDDLDADDWALNCLNGTIDLRTGKLRPHRREDLITKLAPVEFDPDAECVRWESFLVEAVPNLEDRAFLQRFAGYALTGVIREHVLVILCGEGRNGKGTFVETLGKALGDYACAAPADLLLDSHGNKHPTERMVLLGRRLVWASEPSTRQALDTAQVKLITGGDTITARYMRKDFIHFRPTHKLALLTNHAPVVTDTGDAMWERVRLLEWTEQFIGGRAELDLPEKLQDGLPGVLAWAVRGCLAWQQNGLGMSENVKNSTKAYRDDSDPIGGFLATHCVLSPDAKVEARRLREAYTRWCAENGEDPRSRRDVAKLLRARGCTGGHKSNGKNWWRGIGLAAPGPAPT